MDGIINVLKKKAKLSDVKKSKHIAALIINNTPTYISTNKRNNSKPFWPTMHAEVACLRKIKKEKISNKIILIVIRVDKENKLKLSRPCKKCFKHIKKAGIKKIAYSTNDGKIVIEKL